MPILECGSLAPPIPAIQAEMLARFGPTVQLEIGFSKSVPLAAAVPQEEGASIEQGAPSKIVPALIDTGASLSCIDDSIAQELKLPLIDRVKSGGVHGVNYLNLYLGYIHIPALGITQTGQFLGANMEGQPHKALIGRSWLRNMILIYDGRIGSVKLAV